jgi:hypothetical protein
VTPDGHPLVERAWASPGQMMARFEVAGAIGGGRASLLSAEGTRAGGAGPIPSLDPELFQSAIAPTLGPRTRDALSRATSEGEWNTVLLAAPEWMRR